MIPRIVYEGLILCEDLCHNCYVFVVAVGGSLHYHNIFSPFPSAFRLSDQRTFNLTD